MTGSCPCQCHGSSGAFRAPCNVPGGTGCGHLHGTADLPTAVAEYRCPCILCPPSCNRHEDDNRRVHQGCRDRLRRDLNEVPEQYALLGEEVSRQGVAGPKVSGSRDAPVPGRLDVLNLRGPAASGTVHTALNPDTGRLDIRKADPKTGLFPEGDQIGVTPVFAALETWERDWRTSRGLAISGVWPDLETALTEIVRFLDRHLDWACDEHDAIEEFAAELEQVRQAMKAARGDRPDTVYVGRCPTLYDDGPCGVRLYASTGRDVIRCPGCRTEWDHSRWGHLGRVMRGIA